ncbi:MAG: cation-translocating P-type ATPase [Candidatus Paceibacterota bacterium]
MQKNWKTKKTETNWHSVQIKEVEKKTNTNLKTGLDQKTAKKRFKKEGPNKFRKKEKRSFITKIIKQFKNPLVLILFLAGIATLLLREYIDSLVIFIALLINISIETFQEERASNAFEKLSKSQEKYATVIRGGKRSVIPSKELVVGDIVEIETGSYIPADIRLFKIKNLTINESILTGEWKNVQKQSDECPQDAPLTDQLNMAWMGTLAISGSGFGVVIATGEDTQVGKIAESLTGIEREETPIQKNIASIARFLIYIISGAIVLIFVLGIWRGQPFSEMLLIAIAVAVAAMPQGLPPAVTTTLAIGMEKMLKKGGLVRNLLAAETLGATTIILTDKTGTLTKAEMVFKKAITLNSIKDPEEATHLNEDQLKLMKGALMASDAFMDKQNGKWQARGKPTEKAIIDKAFELGITRDNSEEERIDFLPFDINNGFVASLNKTETDKKILYLSGIPEYLIEISEYVLKDGQEVKNDQEKRALFKKEQEEKSKRGMRIIAVAYTEVDWEKISEKGKGPSNDISQQKIVLIGLISFKDPVREDIKASVKKAKQAGARVVMVTGDNPATASEIAYEAGLVEDNSDVKTLTGTEIEDLSDDELYKKIQEVSVFARVLPEQKLRIAKILKGKNEIVAMTGDGVNDAPALRTANIGIAVGSGTEVAKESSDMILKNDSFSIIIDAIGEGRKIVDNLKKIVAYLVSTSFSEIILIGAALVFALPLPLLPTQILWANIIQEGLMSFAYAFEKKEEDLMKRNPRSKRVKEVLSPKLKQAIIIISIVTGTLLFVIFLFTKYKLDLPIEEIRTIMFVALSISSMFFAFSLKDLDKPVWKIDLFDNKYLLVSLTLSLLLLIFAITFAPLKNLLSLVSLNTFQILLLLGAGLTDLIIIEFVKYYLFQRKNND